MVEQEVEWVELNIRKMIAVIRCRTCGHINRAEDYGDQRFGERILIHCPKCNQTRFHTLISKVAEVDISDVVEAVAKKLSEATMKTKSARSEIEPKITKPT